MILSLPHSDSGESHTSNPSIACSRLTAVTVILSFPNSNSGESHTSNPSIASSRLMGVSDINFSPHRLCCDSLGSVIF